MQMKMKRQRLWTDKAWTLALPLMQLQLVLRSLIFAVVDDPSTANNGLVFVFSRHHRHRLNPISPGASTVPESITCLNLTSTGWEKSRMARLTKRNIPLFILPCQGPYSEKLRPKRILIKSRLLRMKALLKTVLTMTWMKLAMLTYSTRLKRSRCCNLKSGFLKIIKLSKIPRLSLRKKTT